MNEADLRKIEAGLHWHKPAASERICQLIAAVRKLSAEQEEAKKRADAFCDALHGHYNVEANLRAAVEQRERERDEARQKAREYYADLAQYVGRYQWDKHWAVDMEECPWLVTDFLKKCIEEMK